DWQRAATAGSDHIVRLWDISDPNNLVELAQMPGHQETIFSIAFHPEGDRLATGSNDGTIRLWNIADPKE
ncbi:MAG: WD40 repeat domain-containing protein, partial [Anaerolineae bacterium]|nr:WD40 repeat domain-containing protein [Anaerolineae bacterium]